MLIFANVIKMVFAFSDYVITIIDGDDTKDMSSSTRHDNALISCRLPLLAISVLSTCRYESNHL